MIAALFIDATGPYANREDVDAWPLERDARQYCGPYPVVAHPPCERWGKYWSGGPSATVRRKLGDDKGCFAAALNAVRLYGGVLEHPAYSHAWKHFGLTRPSATGLWVRADNFGGYTCHVEQGHYGHRARKATWLYAYRTPLPNLIWGPSKSSIRLDEGFHSKEERLAARALKAIPRERLSKRERHVTPAPFADLLIKMAAFAK